MRAKRAICPKCGKPMDECTCGYGGMMKRLSLVVCAALLAVGFSAARLVTHVTPVLAVGACGLNDTPGVVYNNDYAADYLSITNWGPPQQLMSIDTNIGSYRLSGGNGVGTDGHCYFAYTTTDWSSNGYTGTWHAHLRAWICGVGPFEMDSPFNGPGAVSNQVFSGETGLAWYAGQYYTWGNIEKPIPNDGRLVWFQDYDFDLPPGQSHGCPVQADQLSSEARGYGWASNPLSAATYTAGQPYIWYCRENQIHCGSA